ncbi:MAG: hypothetical protein ACOCQD_05485 [archaeon]
MGKQTTQKETIEYIREEDFMSSSLSVEERKEIRNLHKECKQFLKSPKIVKEKVKQFKNQISGSTRDYYIDIIRFLESDQVNMIWGYHKFALNTCTLWQWMEKIRDVKNGWVNY